jgi:restriction endonuclease S subunit
VSDLPALPLDWVYEELGDLIEPGGVSYGIVQPGQRDPFGIPIVRVNNLRQGRIMTDDAFRVSASIESGYARTRLCGGEVLLTLVGSVGEVAIVPKEMAGWNVARAIAVIRPHERTSSQWLKQWLRSPLAQHYMHMWQTTTVQATLNLRDVRRLPVAVPPKSEQQAITEVLGALDDKIEANRTKVSLSYEVLRSTWQLTAKETAETVAVGDIADLDKGLSYKGAGLGSGAPLVNLGNFGVDGLFNADAMKRYSGESRERHWVQDGDLVLANTDLTQRREILGQPSLLL